MCPLIAKDWRKVYDNLLRLMNFLDHTNMPQSACTLRGMKCPFLLRSIFLLAAFCLAGCDSPQATPGERGGAAKFQRPPTAVKVTSVELRAVSDVIEAIGTARANESVTLSAKVTDTINKVRFTDSDFVEAGQVLAELTNTEDTALLAEAEANVTDAQTTLQRIEDLYTKRSIPRSQLDEARARYNGAKARYDSIVARLDNRLIRAPFSGLLGFRQISEGSLITPGTPIVTLDDIATIKLDFTVPEVHLALLRPGLSLLARSSAYPEQQFPATIATIDTRIDSVTRAAQVRALIDNSQRWLKPGMLLTVSLQTATRENLAVPESALVQRNGRVFVYQLAADNRVSLKEVQLGGRFDGFAEILGGVNSGDRVVSEGVLKIRDNAIVEVI